MLANTQGVTYPFWSPDARFVAFFAGGKLKKIPIAGGVPQSLTDVASPRGGSWGSKDVILYTPTAAGVIWSIRPDGSGAAPLTDIIAVKQENSHRWATFLPDGDHFLFWAGNFRRERDDKDSGIYLSSVSKKEKKLIVLANSNAAYADGNLFYVDDKRQLIGVPFDIGKARISGEPRVVGGKVDFQPSTFWGIFAASEDGTLVLNTSNQEVLSALTWFDRSGKRLGQVGEPAIIATPSLSPN